MKQRDSEFALLIAGHGLECCGFSHPGQPGIQAGLEQDAKPNHGLECHSTPDLQQMQIRVCVFLAPCSLFCYNLTCIASRNGVPQHTTTNMEQGRTCVLVL